MVDYLDNAIIFVLGRNDNLDYILTTSKIIKILQSPREYGLYFHPCPTRLLPKTNQTIYNRINNLIKQDFLYQEGYDENTGAAPGKILKLTEKGTKYYSELKHIYPVEELLPNFDQFNDCVDCDPDLKEYCVDKIIYEDFLYTYKSLYNIEDSLYIRELLNEYDVKSLKEILFYLTLNKSAKKMLKYKYPDVRME
jgi:hypothetical protein